MNIWQALTMTFIVAMAIVTVYLVFFSRQQSGRRHGRSDAAAARFAWNDRFAAIANDLRMCKTTAEFSNLSPAELREVFTTKSSGLNTLEGWLRQNRTVFPTKSNARIVMHLTKAREIERALASGLEKLDTNKESKLGDLDTHNRNAVELLMQSLAAEMRAMSVVLNGRFEQD